MTSAQVVETSVTTTNNSPSQDYTHPDNQTTLLHVTNGFKTFTVKAVLLASQQLHNFSVKQLREKDCNKKLNELYPTPRSLYLVLLFN